MSYQIFIFNIATNNGEWESAFEGSDNPVNGNRTCLTCVSGLLVSSTIITAPNSDIEL